MCCRRGTNKSSVYNLEEVQSANSYYWWNMVTESKVSTQAYIVPLTLVNRRQKVVLFQSSYLRFRF